MLLEEMLKTKSREEVYDSVLVPALSMIEEARHSEEMTGARAEQVLQAVEELAEDVTSRAGDGRRGEDEAGQASGMCACERLCR